MIIYVLDLIMQLLDNSN